MRKRLICISCPIGCEITVQIENDTVSSIEGNRCPRGEAYAREELTDPKRILTTSVRVVGGNRPLVSVRTDRPIRKGLIPQAMRAAWAARAEAPVRIGQVIVADVAGTGANLVATRPVDLSPQTECPRRS